jgi:hypothetical protein
MLAVVVLVQRAVQVLLLEGLQESLVVVDRQMEQGRGLV